MTESQKSPDQSPSQRAIIAELKSISHSLEEKHVKAQYVDDSQANRPQTDSPQMDSPQLEFSEFTQRALNELQALHQSLQAKHASKSTKTTSPLASQRQQDCSNPNVPNAKPNTKSNPKPNNRKARSKPLIRRGGKEIQASLFDEPPQGPTSLPDSQSRELQSPRQQPTESRTTSVDATTNQQIDQLVDELVAEYLPKIEEKLRTELKRLLAKD